MVNLQPPVPLNVNNFLLPPVDTLMQLLPVQFDASTGSATLDLSYNQSQGQASVIQSMIVDTTNLSTGSSITITVGQQVLFTFEVASGVYQSYNIPAATKPWFSFVSSSGSTGICNIWLQNYPTFPQQYNQATTSSGTQNVNVTNTVDVVFPGAQPVTIAGSSGTLASTVQNVASHVLGTDFLDKIDTAFTNTFSTTAIYNGPSCVFTDINVRVLTGSAVASAGTVNLTITIGGYSIVVPIVLTTTASTSELFIKVYNGGSRGIKFNQIVASISSALSSGGIVLFGSGINTSTPID